MNEKQAEMKRTLYFEVQGRSSMANTEIAVKLDCTLNLFITPLSVIQVNTLFLDRLFLNIVRWI